MGNFIDSTLTIYTDGSSYQGPRTGGVGIVFVYTDEDWNEHTYEHPMPGWPGATNNEMELQAVIEALKVATGRRPPVDPSGYDKILVLTDSAYVADNFPRAVHQWSKNGYRLAGGKSPENLRQWKELMTLVRRVRRSFKWVDMRQISRRSDEHSRRVDNLAKQSAKNPMVTRRPLRPRNVARKLSEEQVDPGCVEMGGQTETIRIIGHWTLSSPHFGFRYKYEIVGGPNDQLVDIADSVAVMNRTHKYVVQFNDDQGHPQILEVLSEVEPEPAEDGSPKP